MKRLIKKGSTDQTLDIFVQDSSVTTGAGLTGLVFNSGSLVCYYRRGATGTATALTLATQTVGGAHSDGGFVEISSANMPGMYRLDLSDAIIATGVPYVTLMLKGATNMAPVTIELQLVNHDPENDALATTTNITAGTITTVTNLTNAPTVGDLTAAMKASVNTEVLDVLNVDTFAEIGQETPAATQTIRKMLAYLYKAWRNKKTQTGSLLSLFNDDAVTVDQKSTTSNDGTTFTAGEMATGP